jgi:dTDP-4-amino-4,6-dideoxygalactose transaminase
VIAGINGGGVFLTDDKQKADQVKKIRRHGRRQDFEMLGYNSRLYALNAEIIQLRLRERAATQATRQSIANKYIIDFEGLPVYTQKMTPGLDHNYHKFVIRFDSAELRNQAKQRLNASVHYDTPLTLNSMYKDISYREDHCCNAKTAADTVLSLPVHAWLTDQEISSISDTIKSLF